MKFTKKRLIILAAVFFAVLIGLSLYYRFKPSTSVESSNSTSSSNEDIPTVQRPENQVGFYAYEQINVTNDLINSGVIPSCCKDFYRAGNPALIIRSIEPDGSTKRYWYNIQSGGKTSFEFLPETGSNISFSGKALPTSISNAKSSWSFIKLNDGDTSTNVQVNDVNTAIKFVQYTFSSIPSSGEDF